MNNHRNLDNAEFNQLVRTVAYAPSPVERQRGIAQVMGALVATDVLGIWARKLCRYPELREDAQSVISEKILRALNLISPADFERIGDCLKYLWGQAERTVRDYLSSNEVTPASGMSGVVRRSWTVARTSAELSTTLGRTPTPQEVIARANEQTLSRDKNPAKHGTLLSEADFTGMAKSPNFTSTLEDSEGILAEHRFDASYMETRVEASLAFKHVVEECRRLYPGDIDSLEVARVWAALMLQGEASSVLQIANRTGFSRERSRSLLSKLELVLGEVRAQSETVSK